jgi:TfoX/Sxy family transcriptional regulator of competence genes
MAWDEGLADLSRDDLTGEPITERKMFGGLCFLRQGHMVCCIHRGGAMFRVGKPNEAAACAVGGVAPMRMADRSMPGMVTAEAEALADDTRRAALMGLALGFVRTLPPK